MVRRLAVGKISQEAKNRYFEKVKEYKQQTEAILKREQQILEIIGKGDPGAAYKRMALAEDRLNLAAVYLLLNRVSVSLLGVKNDAFLNDARKSCYECIIFLEEVVSNYLDAAFSEYSEMLESIESYPDERRYELCRKIGFTIQSVEEDFGENTKWRWSFVELEGRYATVSKNLLNMKTLVAGLDPRVNGYEQRLAHLKLVKTLLKSSAERYRHKYELSTSRIDDFRQAIGFLAALKRLHTVLGETDQAEQAKRQADVWRSKMDADAKRLETRDRG
jgi:hypothetical protein